MTNIIRVSKQGVDVLGTAGTVPNNLIFDSYLNTFKILNHGTTAITVTSPSNGTLTVAHGQSVPPFVYSFVQWGDGKVGMPFSIKKGVSHVYNLDLVNIDYTVDSTNIKWVFTNISGASETIKVAYYVCEAPATT